MMLASSRSSRLRFLGAAASAAVLAPTLQARAAEAYTMRLSTTDSSTNPFTLAGIHFAQGVNRRSNGQLKIEVFPNSQLVSQEGTVDALRGGSIDFTVQANYIMTPLLPKLQVFDLPFLFKDFASTYRVLDGPVGQEIAADLSTRGVEVLTWGIGGFKEISTTTRVVTVPEDMRGLRMRVQNAAISVAMYQALGAVPITIDSSEIYVALTQKTVDAIDVNLSAVMSQKYYTVVRHVAMANHVVSVEPLYGSKRKIEALPQPLQKIIRDEGKALAPYWRNLTATQLDADIQSLKSNGVAFSNIQFAPFRKAMAPVYASVQAKVGADLIDRVAKAAGA